VTGKGWWVDNTSPNGEINLIEYPWNDSVLTLYGTVSGDTLTGYYHWDKHNYAFSLTMSTSGDFARGYRSDNAVLRMARLHPQYGINNPIPEDRYLKDGTLFTGPTGTAGKYSWDGEWRRLEAADKSPVSVGHPYTFNQSGNWVTGYFGWAWYDITHGYCLRAYVYGDTIIGTALYGYDIHDFKIKMNPDGLTATGTEWLVGSPGGRVEKPFTLERWYDGRYAEKGESVPWSKTSAVYSFTGTWDFPDLVLANNFKLNKMELKQFSDLTVTGTINGNSSSLVRGKILGRNLYMEVRYDGYYDFLWWRISEDGKTLISDWGRTGERRPAPNINTASSWAQDSITVAVANGYVPGDLQNNYKNVITRQEFCRMAVKWVEYATGKKIDTILTEQGKSRTNPFTDTSDPDILAAYALGITNGTSATTFTPNGQFSREQAATMIMNTCRAIGVNVSNPPAFGFADIKTASSWAVDGINFVGANKIMQGTGNNNFSPKATYTREQSIITFSNINPDAFGKG